MYILSISIIFQEIVLEDKTIKRKFYFHGDKEVGLLAMLDETGYHYFHYDILGYGLRK